MGSSQSVQLLSDDEHSQQAQQDDDDDDEEEEEEEVEHHNLPSNDRAIDDETFVKKILQQEPEMLPFHSSASPLSPQLSTHTTPRIAPSIKVWDPYNVLAPPPSHFQRSFSSDLDSISEVYLICQGECHMSLRPDLIPGRCPDAALTPNGKRQARALAVFLKSRGVRFNAVYASPLDRVRATALPVCQELNYSEEQIQSADALVEMSQGDWEGCHRSEIFTPETVRLMDRIQPDFAAPSGESLRQVEFRMVQFLNDRIMALPEKLRSDFSPPDHNDNPAFSNGPRDLGNLIHDRDRISLTPAHWDLLHRHRQGIPRKKSGKSRLQIVTTTGDHEADDEMSPRQPIVNQGSVREINVRSSTTMSLSCIGVFSHSTPIKCLLTGLLGCSSAVTHMFCIEDSSITVLQHSWKLGWQIKRMNDTSHLKLL